MYTGPYKASLFLARVCLLSMASLHILSNTGSPRGSIGSGLIMGGHCGFVSIRLLSSVRVIRTWSDQSSDFIGSAFGSGSTILIAFPGS
ncbi:hypothetical protein B0H10DRAFT_2257616 [Mycena sp. CBHHK59/15]|nr:hypothetical protein B0H10DRAFT_2257616 [Mycena sp. CBHHK59/15]